MSEHDGSLATGRIVYKNHRGEIGTRCILPRKVWWGTSEYHEGAQWFLKAWCEDRKDYRDFAMKDIMKWE